mmetsp:Transcript_17731/g.44981  ORF Transcript_17731/g.44981 Transcript_17731/m.44981 type:complete len:263 (-) Transcript_17731:35-823(-)
MLPRCCRNLAVLDVLDRQHQVDDFARRGERVHVCKENLQLTLQVLDGGALNQLDGLAQHVGQLSRKVKQSTALVEAVAEGQNIVGAVEAGPCHVLERFCEDEIVRSILPHLGLVRVLVLERGASGQNASLGKQRHEAGQKFASGELDPAGFGVGDKSDLAELQSAAKEVDGRLLEDLELFRDLIRDHSAVQPEALSGEPATREDGVIVIDDEYRSFGGAESRDTSLPLGAIAIAREASGRSGVGWSHQHLPRGSRHLELGVR